ncbi:msb1l [Drosophila busckii]|uniref:Msb1l n=1 Tax=Drosophila busckii TaxID=30019 RepID=A0A0M3QTI1_DROBS|nr:uncharacterized protein LOC108607823 [Drosophila busckii]ALC38929.1 msb1l [Drosophila busckii]
MGAKATKMDGSYLPDTPTLNNMRMERKYQKTEMEMSTPIKSSDPDPNALLDPRSPSGCRTPMNFLAPQVQVAKVVPATEACGENAFAQFRKRLLKGFSLDDPRSPQLNRTPLILDEVIDRTLNMDDTFSDLFVETRVPATAVTEPVADEKPIELEPPMEMELPSPISHNNSSLEIESIIYDEETMPCDMMLQKTPPQQPYDPRSPTVGVERTPIIFCDDEDEEARETQMLEDILQTLTLNLSNESSMASFASATGEFEMTLDEPQAQAPTQASKPAAPTNKHLDRVRLGNKRRVAPRKPARASKSQIYVDANEGGVTSTPKTTPQSAQRTHRTPLGSVNRNRMHLRSRSVEKDLRKTPLSLKSFDDQLNPSERRNVPSIHMLMTGDDGFDG